MRLTFRILFALAASVLLATASGAEEASQTELEAMKDQLRALQDQIQAQQDQLDSQRQQLEDAGLSDADSGVRSKLSSFLEETEFDGWVAASYTINSRNRGNNNLLNQNIGGPAAGGFRTGALGPVTEPLHPDNNTFSVDQVWFRMHNASTEESRAGFHADLVLGKTAETFGGARGPGNGGDVIELFTAYVTYLAPVGNGMEFALGKLPTLLGAEVVPTTENWFVTRGIVWSLQPVTHTGLIGSTEVGGGVSLSAGVVNDVYTDTIADNNKNKALTGQIAWENDLVYAGASVIWGAPVAGNEGIKSGVADLVVSVTPNDRIGMWLNYDYIWNDGGLVAGGPATTNKFTSAHALAIAGRVQVLERTGLAIRWEGAWEDEANTTNAASPFASALGLGGHGSIYSLTGTIDHLLTDNLLLRGEARYDWVEVYSAADNFFNNGNGGASRNDQGVFLVEAVYTF